MQVIMFLGYQLCFKDTRTFGIVRSTIDSTLAFHKTAFSSKRQQLLEQSVSFVASLCKETMGSSHDDEAVEALKQRTQPHLMPQDAKSVDPSKLTALTPEVVRPSVSPVLRSVIYAVSFQLTFLLSYVRNCSYRFPAKQQLMLVLLAMSLMESLQLSRLLVESKLFDSRMNWNVTLQSNWAMPMPRFTRAILSQIPVDDILLVAQIIRMSLKKVASPTV